MMQLNPQAAPFHLPDYTPPPPPPPLPCPPNVDASHPPITYCPLLCSDHHDLVCPLGPLPPPPPPLPPSLHYCFPSIYSTPILPNSFPYPSYYTSYVTTGLPVKPFLLSSCTELKATGGNEVVVDVPDKPEAKEEALVKEETKGWKARRCYGCRGGRASLTAAARKKLVWLPKRSHGAPHVFSTVPKPVFLEFGLKEIEMKGEVTLMIRNIPNKYSRQMLMDMLDKHCFEGNHKLPNDHERSRSKYDFLYLPIDFRHKGNLGYAFVNFTTKEAAARFYDAMHGQKWESFQSRKICCVCFARIQGRKRLMSNFMSSRFPCDSEEFLPVVFDPPRDGCGSRPLPVTVGRRVTASDVA